MVKTKQWQSSTTTMAKANQMSMTKEKQWQPTTAKAMVAFYGKNNSILWKSSASLWLMQFYANARYGKAMQQQKQQQLHGQSKTTVAYCSKSNGSANADLQLMQVYYSFGYSNNSLESQLQLLQKNQMVAAANVDLKDHQN